MKLTSKICVAGLLTLSMGTFTACDYLDIEPENKVPETKVDFTQTQNMYEPVSGVYGALRTKGMHWVLNMMSVVRDGDVWSGRVDDQADLVTIGNKYQYNNAWWGFKEMWNQYYGMIQVANAALESLDGYAQYITSDADKKLYKSYCGEVRILRALAYYRLCEYFGDVTILRTNKQTDLTRSKRDVVYEYVLKDLEQPMADCPFLRPNEMEHKGAVSAYTAYMLAAKMNLNMGKYDEVERLTDKIINDGRFSLYSDFYQLFKIPGKLCDESLLECQTTDFGEGSGPMVDADQFFNCAGPRITTDREGANPKSSAGWNFIGYFDSFVAWAENRGETVRANTSFLKGGELTPSGDMVQKAGNPANTNCWNGKWYVPLEQFTPGRNKYGCNNNIRVLRYAEVLLMNAEAKIRLNKNGDAPFNLVRTRAHMPELSGVTIDQVLDERRMELCCEWGARYEDLLRTGKAASVLGGMGWTPEKAYFPLPLETMSLSPAVTNEPYTSLQ